MKILTIPALLGLFCVAIAMHPQKAFAQDDATKIAVKMRKLDLYNQILPVLMRPEQISKILPAIERARAAERKIEAEELAVMKNLESKLDKAIDDAETKSLVPSKELQMEIISSLRDFSKKRAILVLEQNENVLKAIEETLDEGQIKAAANAITIPDAEKGKLADRDRLRRWVRAVLKDTAAYDILVKLSRKTSS